jgi:hypothetical protein
MSDGANIVSLSDARAEKEGDNAAFLGCPNCEAQDWAVVCRFEAGRPYVSALVCTACEPPTEVCVQNGLLSV